MAKLSDPCVVYWKHTPGMTSWDQGYIGISGNFNYRMKTHDRDAYLMNSPLEVHHQMRLNEGNVITDIIFEGTRQQCLDMEFELRPRWHMAWNMAAGGMFSNEWKAGGDWLSNKLWHPKYGEEKVNKCNTLSDITRRYYPNLNSVGGVAGDFGKVLRGMMPHSKGWELQDAQLAERVWDRCKRPIDSICFMSGVDNIKVYPNGYADLGTRLKAHAGRIKDCAKGLRPSAAGYSLCTEEEYLANPGPVFGTEE